MKTDRAAPAHRGRVILEAGIYPLYEANTTAAYTLEEGVERGNNKNWQLVFIRVEELGFRWQIVEINVEATVVIRVKVTVGLYWIMQELAAHCKFVKVLFA